MTTQAFAGLQNDSFSRDYDADPSVTSTNKAFAGLQINGVTEDAETGSLVASAGDINGDGIDDILIRSSNDEDGRLFDDVYIVYGTDTDFDATLDLDKLDGDNGFKITGVSLGSNRSFTAASAIFA